jgi:hypothetical protein
MGAEIQVIQLRLEAGRAQLRTQERDDVGHQAVPDEDDADQPRAAARANVSPS